MPVLSKTNIQTASTFPLVSQNSEANSEIKRFIGIGKALAATHQYY